MYFHAPQAMFGGVKSRSTELAGNATNKCVLAAIEHTDDNVRLLMSSTLCLYVLQDDLPTMFHMTDKVMNERTKQLLNPT